MFIIFIDIYLRGRQIVLGGDNSPEYIYNTTILFIIFYYDASSFIYLTILYLSLLIIKKAPTPMPTDPPISEAPTPPPQPQSCTAANPSCPSAAEFCQLPTGTCSGGGSGTCNDKPDALTCDEVNGVPVCGCNGVTYDNECYAWSVGVSIDSYSSCETDSPTPAPQIVTDSPTKKPTVSFTNY